MQTPPTTKKQVTWPGGYAAGRNIFVAEQSWCSGKKIVTSFRVRMMLKNIIFLAVCVAIAAAAWALFYVLGNYAFLLMLVITLAMLIKRTGKPKFSARK